MMKIFRDPDQRLRCFISLTAVALLIAVAFILFGVLSLSGQVKRFAEISQQRWNALADANPDISVPKLIDGKTPQIIIEEKPEPSPSSTPAPSPTATPSPLPTPRPQVKTRTVVRYRKQPTPKPFFNLFKSTR